MVLTASDVGRRSRDVAALVLLQITATEAEQLWWHPGCMRRQGAEHVFTSAALLYDGVVAGFVCRRVSQTMTVLLLWLLATWCSCCSGVSVCADLAVCNCMASVCAGQFSFRSSCSMHLLAWGLTGSQHFALHACGGATCMGQALCIQLFLF